MSKLDYLKRYMSKDETPDDNEKPKKKKKKSKSSKSSSGFRIIDSDAFPQPDDSKKSKRRGSDVVEVDEADELLATQEEKPQIAAIIDERPTKEIMREKFTTARWQTEDSVENRKMIKEEPQSPPRRRHDSDASPRRRRHDSDASPQRRRHDSDASPPRRRHDSDASPPRRRHDSDASPPRRRHDSDALPPRRRHDSDASPPRRRHDSDASHPRRRHDSDASPPRRRHDSDASPPRRRHDSDASPPRKRHDSDASPPRRRHNSDASPPRRSHVLKKEADLSPPRKRPHLEGVKIKQEVCDDLSPPRRTKQFSDLAIKREIDDSSPPRRIKKELSDLSPPRRKDKLMSKTLGGKKAGLQDAKSLKDELLKLKEKERRNFEMLGSEVTGRDAETRVRGRLKEKADRDKEKEEREAKFRQELTEKHEKWNKGLKQLEKQKEHIQEILHEMDKPLARSKDDADLDIHLREVDRQEDPMLEYIRKKKEKKLQASGVAIPQYPKYRGPEPPPNRFGIRPGYRWDGVDRSTGFEKKLFERKNQKRAIAEEAYKWSTEDM